MKERILTVFNDLTGDNVGQSCKQDTLVSLVSTSVTGRAMTAHNIHVVPYSVWESEVP